MSRSLVPSESLSMLRRGRLMKVADAVLHVAECSLERRLLLQIGAFDGSRVLDAPMRRHRLAGPDRTCFARGVVANGEHEIHRGRARAGEFLPALRAHVVDGIAGFGEDAQRHRMHGAFRRAAGRKAAEAAGAILAQDRLREDRARRVAGAEEEDVVGIRHGIEPCVSVGNRAADL